MNALTAPSNVSAPSQNAPHIECELRFAPDESGPAQVLNRLMNVVAPAARPEEEPSALYARMLAARADYQRTHVLTDELRRTIESTISEADTEQYRGNSPKVVELENALTELSRQLRDNFPRGMRTEAQRLKKQIDAELETMPAAQRYCYRLCSELLALATDVREKLDLIGTLKTISPECAQKTQLLNELTGPALALSNRYERVQLALELEKNLPARIRFAYAGMLAVEADKNVQPAEPLEDTAEHRQARQLLREAAYGDRSLLRDPSFLAFAQQLGSTDLVRLAEQGDD